ncbi:hypothetical protein K438DRAFT_1973833 [Mycena galopus ATCC 62051]|nr:hypothetical protein K438DRAFT_1973833 [Mycena galopus ATCC 62051]
MSDEYTIKPRVDRALRVCSPHIIPPPASSCLTRSSPLRAPLSHQIPVLTACARRAVRNPLLSPPAFHQPPASTLGNAPRSIPLISVRIHTGASAPPRYLALVDAPPPPVYIDLAPNAHPTRTCTTNGASKVAPGGLSRLHLTAARTSPSRL